MADQNELPAGYTIKELTGENFHPLIEKRRAEIFSEDLILEPEFTEQEQTQMDRLKNNLGVPYRLYLALYHQGQLVGWCWGQQITFESFYMANSAVLPDHREKGLYRALLAHTLEKVTEAGFQILTSRHTATNNAIIIPKLQAGFLITGMELNDVFGTLVRLTYFVSNKRRKVMDFRCGHAKSASA